MREHVYMTAFACSSQKRASDTLELESQMVQVTTCYRGQELNLCPLEDRCVLLISSHASSAPASVYSLRWCLAVEPRLYPKAVLVGQIIQRLPCLHLSVRISGE